VKDQPQRSVPAPPPVEIRASKKRRSTVSASWEDGRIVVLVPSRLASEERDAVVDELVQRLLRRAPMHHSDDLALEHRAEELADTYLDGVRASSVRWVGNQRKRWGSCSPATREIRMSDRLRPVPHWVLDAVLVHELAHLIEPSHSRRFRSLTARYPRMSEADTFLHGFSVGLEASQERIRQQATDPTRAIDQANLRPEPFGPFSPGLLARQPQDDVCYDIASQGLLFDLAK
jgi:YgjP-like, metallopeptidase domain